MDKRTPGEWKTGREDMQSYDGATGAPFTNIYHKTITGRLHLGNPLPLVIGKAVGENNKANAAFIVKACNLHEELVEHLRIMYSLCRLKYGNLDAGVWQQIQATEELIKKAEGHESYRGERENE